MQRLVLLLIFCLLYCSKAYSAVLDLKFAGTGGGSVNGDMSCTTGTVCAPKSFSTGEYVILLVSPNTLSTFSGWSGACTSAPCFFPMDGDKTATATFAAASKVKIGTNVFSDMQSGYDDLSTTSGVTIKLLNGVLPCTISAGKDIVVTLEGGYNATYDTINSATIIQSPMVIKAGTVRIGGAIYVKSASQDTNEAPVAYAGKAQSVVVGTVAMLDGSGSSGANGDLLTYNWSLISKPASSIAEFTIANVAKPSFTPDVAGVYTFSLVVNDGKINSISANTTVTAVIAGKLTTRIGNKGHATSIVVQPDGKIVVAGVSNISLSDDVAVARYNIDGSLDTSFSGDGIVTKNIAGRTNSIDWVRGVALQSDGKIVVVGYSETYMIDHMYVTVVRYKSDGSLDTTFNGTGIVTTDGGVKDLMGHSVVIQPDGKILVAGVANLTNRYTAGYGTLLVRYNSDGTLDNSFNGTGILIDTSTLGVVNVALQTDDKILVVGTINHGNGNAISLVRYNSDGSNDTSFAGTGRAYTEIGSEIGSFNTGDSMALQTDGKIVVAGTSYTPSSGNDFNVVRYNSDGSLDSGFADGGIAITTDIGFQTDDAVHSVMIQPNGKILVAGTSMYTRSDPFPYPGVYRAGNSDFALIRYNSNGSIDNSFASAGKLTTDFRNFEDIFYCMALQTDGAILLAGSSETYVPDVHDSYTSFAVSRYTPDGSLDPTFNVSQ